MVLNMKICKVKRQYTESIFQAISCSMFMCSVNIFQSIEQTVAKHNKVATQPKQQHCKQLFFLNAREENNSIVNNEKTRALLTRKEDNSIANRCFFERIQGEKTTDRKRCSSFPLHSCLPTFCA